MFQLARFAIGFVLIFVFTPAIAQQDPPIPPTPSDKPGSIERMDYGSVIAHTIHAPWPKKNISFKGLAIRLKHPVTGKDAVMVYDTDLLRVAATSFDGFIDLSKTNHTSYKGVDDARLAGTQHLGTAMSPGWANPNGLVNDVFKDPRSYANGPLPKAWMQFKGLYKHGDQVVLRYSVGQCEVLELPGIEKIGDDVFFTRTLELTGKSERLDVAICDLEIDAKKSLAVVAGRTAFFEAAKGVSIGLVADDDTQASLKTIDGRVVASFAPGARRVKILMGVDVKAMDSVVNRATPASGLIDLTRGGPAQWKESVQTKGTISAAKTPYVIDTLTVPEKNPWNSWMRIVGFDFFKDGTKAAISTWNGDVWIVSGIDDKLDKLSWKRFATGLYEPLGLVVKDEQIYALGYDRITRLHDLNGDGEADHYENFHSDWITHPRAYMLCLSTDSQGNFYTIANGNRAHDVPLHGCLYRISPDGGKLDVVATGLRSANGLGTGPGNALAVADQEGNWTPATRIDLVKQGDFIGYKPHAHTAKPPETFKPPLCWLPKQVDNSAGDLLWVPVDPQSRWGPLQGQLLGMSYGMCRLYLVPHETVNGTEQGGVVPFPLTFSSGIMRGRFNPHDGQLYLAGLKGWQTRGAFDGGFYRVRYTGAKVHMPVAIHPTNTGVTLTFTHPLDAEVAEDVSSYEVKRWNYVYSEKYGSPEMSVADPKKQGRDVMQVKSAALSKDGKTVTLTIEDMKPVMQMMVKMNLESVDGETVKHEVYHTVHALSEK